MIDLSTINEEIARAKQLLSEEVPKDWAELMRYRSELLAERARLLYLVHEIERELAEMGGVPQGQEWEKIVSPNNQETQNTENNNNNSSNLREELLEAMKKRIEGENNNEGLLASTGTNKPHIVIGGGVAPQLPGSPSLPVRGGGVAPRPRTSGIKSVGEEVEL